MGRGVGLAEQTHISVSSLIALTLACAAQSEHGAGAATTADATARPRRTERRRGERSTAHTADGTAAARTADRSFGADSLDDTKGQWQRVYTAIAVRWPYATEGSFLCVAWFLSVPSFVQQTPW